MEPEPEQPFFTPRTRLEIIKKGREQKLHRVEAELKEELRTPRLCPCHAEYLMDTIREMKNYIWTVKRDIEYGDPPGSPELSPYFVQCYGLEYLRYLAPVYKTTEPSDELGLV